MSKKIKCDIYTRVSTTMQVDGYNLDAFAFSFIKGVLDNPIYCGKLAYGRRKNEKVSGTRNEYRIGQAETRHY